MPRSTSQSRRPTCKGEFNLLDLLEGVRRGKEDLHRLQRFAVIGSNSKAINSWFAFRDGEADRAARPGAVGPLDVYRAGESSGFKLSSKRKIVEDRIIGRRENRDPVDLAPDARLIVAKPEPVSTFPVASTATAAPPTDAPKVETSEFELSINNWVPALQLDCPQLVSMTNVACAALVAPRAALVAIAKAEVRR